MDVKSLKKGKTKGIVIGVLVALLVVGGGAAAIYGGQAGWFSGSLMNTKLKATTTTTVKPKTTTTPSSTTTTTTTTDKPADTSTNDLAYLAFYSARKDIPDSNHNRYDASIVNSGRAVLLGSFKMIASDQDQAILKGITFTCANGNLCKDYLSNFVLYNDFYDQGPWLLKITPTFTNNKLIFSFPTAPVRVTSYGESVVQVYGQITANPKEQILALDLLPEDVVAEGVNGENILIQPCIIQDSQYQTGTKNGCTYSEAETFDITINK